MLLQKCATTKVTARRLVTRLRVCGAILLAACLAPTAGAADQKRDTNDSGWAVASPRLAAPSNVLGPKSINLDRVVTPEVIRNLKVQDTPAGDRSLKWQKARVARRSDVRASQPLKPVPEEADELQGRSLGDRFEVSDIPQTQVVPETQALPEGPPRAPVSTGQQPPQSAQHRPAPFEADDAAPLLGEPKTTQQAGPSLQSPRVNAEPQESAPAAPRDTDEVAPAEAPEDEEERDSRFVGEEKSEATPTPDTSKSAEKSPVQQKPTARSAPSNTQTTPPANSARQSVKPNKNRQPPKEIEKPKRELPPLTRQQQSLRSRIRSVLSYYYRRPLNSVDHDSWEVMHSMLSYGLHSRVQEGGRRSRPVTAVGHLCFNRPCKRYQMLYITPEGHLDVRVGVGMQGHKGQLLAMLAQCNVSPDYPIRVEGKDFTIHDLIAAEQLTCYARTELSFKLIALMHYLPSDTTWVNDQGENWDIPKLIADERTQKIRGAACGGTHRLGGLALAVRKRVARGEPLDGEWQEAHKMVQQYQQYAFRLQNRDGSLSTEWFRGPGAEQDIDRRVRTTGHLLEWLIYSLPEEDVATDKRVFAAVNYLTNLIMSNTSNGWEVGPLCHALHALLLYDEKVFRPYDDSEASQIAGGKSRRQSKPNYLDLSSPFSESYFYVEARHEERKEREESGPFGGLFGRRSSSDRR